MSDKESLYLSVEWTPARHLWGQTSWKYPQNCLGLQQYTNQANWTQQERFSPAGSIWGRLWPLRGSLWSIAELISPFKAFFRVAPKACAINFILFRAAAALSVENNTNAILLSVLKAWLGYIRSSPSESFTTSNKSWSWHSQVWVILL